MIAIAIAANILGWTFATFLLWGHGALLGLAALAYGLGLRHAIDADHIAAIDNVTRRLTQNGRPAGGVGYYFSLGHSTVVVLAVLASWFASSKLRLVSDAARHDMALFGTVVSAGFLLLIATINLSTLPSGYRTLRALKRGISVAAPAGPRGLLSHLLRPVLKLVGSSWQAYPLGFLFGLGFDTASEIALLALSAAEAARGHSLMVVLVFPLLFTAGMALVDTMNGAAMARLYRWSFADKGFAAAYSVAMTSFSGIVALLVGVVEIAGLFLRRATPHGAFADLIGLLGRHTADIGVAIIVAGVAVWCGALFLSRRAWLPDPANRA